MRALIRLILPVIAVLLASGCASQMAYDPVTGFCPPPEEGASEAMAASVGPASAVSEETVDQRLRALITVDDPWVRVNRGLYAFNAVFDEYIFLPIVNAYEAVVPEILRDRVHDFFANIDDFNNFGNLVLQGRVGPAGETAFRVLVNSSIGFAGLIDVASASGIPRYPEDFGQTLGCWGVGHGPYVMLPVLGPSNARDTVGRVVDSVVFWVVDPFGISSFQSDHPYLIALDGIDQRANIPFEYFSTGSPFEYDYIRLLYTKKRQADVRN